MEDTWRYKGYRIQGDLKDGGYREIQKDGGYREI